LVVFFHHDQAWTSSYYLGVGALLLALLAIWTVRSGRIWLLTAAGAAALVLAFGNHSFIYRGLRHVLPQLSLMTYPVKFVTLIIFVAPLLGAFAIAQIQASATKERVGKQLTILCVVLLATIAAILLCAGR